MKLGIMIDKTGIFLFGLSENKKLITKSYVQKNMLGWLFHDQNIYDYISLLPIEKYLISGKSDSSEELIEITGEETQEFLATIKDRKNQKIKKQ